VGAIYASAVEWSGGSPLPIPQSASAPGHLDFLDVGVVAPYLLNSVSERVMACIVPNRESKAHEPE
jgi:hypothetical protein